jgi:hypothetical protein
MPQSTIAVSQMPLLPIGLSSTKNANARAAMAAYTLIRPHNPNRPESLKALSLP